MNVIQTVRDFVKPGTDSIVDETYYLERNPDVKEAKIKPRVHFTRHGAEEERLPNPWFSAPYVFNQLDQSAWRDQTATSAYLNSNLHRKKRLIFVSHDATRTGAPAIILRLLELFSQSDHFECFCLLDGGGERLNEFQELAHTYVMSRSRLDPSFSHQDAFSELRDVFSDGLFHGNLPVMAIVNSAESYRLGTFLSTLEIPIFSLIHEVASYYPTRVFEDFVKFSRLVIFPSQFIQETAMQYCQIEKEKTRVRGQGVLEDDFGLLNKDTCREQLREDLQLEQNAFIVIGVGSKEIRKGIDLFVDTARMYFQTNPEDTTTCFAWFGKSNELDEATIYAQYMASTSKWADRIILKPSTSKIELVFTGADLFFLSSRADPFPCVVHEAMACGLPVIAFEGGGGAPELIGEDCGFAVKVGHLPQIVEKIKTYRDHPNVHRTHSQNAIQKIKSNWQFRDYFDDLLTLFDNELSFLNRKLPVKSPPKHLLIMRGTMSDYALVKALREEQGFDVSKVSLLYGRFHPDVPEVIELLKKDGIAYRVHQVQDHSIASYRRLVTSLLLKPRPQQVTMLDIGQYLDGRTLRILPYPKHLISVNESMDLEDLLELFASVEEVSCGSNELMKVIALVNEPLTKNITRIQP